MILISVAGVPLSNSLNNILKRRNLPPLLSAYCLLKIVQITVQTNIGYVGVSTEQDSLLSTLSTARESIKTLPEKGNIENKTFNIEFLYTNFSFGETEAGADKIFFSIFQSPSFTFHETSLLTNIFISLGILLFSPYMYVYSMEGAALAYLVCLAVGLDTDGLARLQYCLAGLLTNSCLALHLVPAPGSHVAGKGRVHLISICNLMN